MKNINILLMIAVSITVLAAAVDGKCVYETCKKMCSKHPKAFCKYDKCYCAGPKRTPPKKGTTLPPQSVGVSQPSGQTGPAAPPVQTAPSMPSGPTGQPPSANVHMHHEGCGIHIHAHVTHDLNGHVTPDVKGHVTPIM